MQKIWIDESIYLKKKVGMGAFILTLFASLNINNLSYKSIKVDLPDKMRFKPFFLIIWQNTFLYLKTLIEKPQYIIFPCFLSPFLKVKGVRYITVIHDLCSFKPELMKKGIAKIHRYGIKNAIKNADTIITVSETIKNEFIQKFDINPDRIAVVYNSIGEHFIKNIENADILEKYNISKHKYILSVATLNINKNIPSLIKAFESISDRYPDLKLVLVGGMGNEQKEKLTHNKNVIFTGYIKDEEIPILYKNALLYAYPSLYEGFGIPLIEAQYCECPILCSDIPVFREIGADSVEYCDTKVEGISEALEQLINNKERLKELSLLGKNNVKRFSIDKIAKQVMEVIDAK